MSKFASVVEALQHRVDKSGDQLAYIFYNDQGRSCTLTWRRLHELSGRWAAVLRKGGAQRGQVVVNTLLNSPERLVTEVATMMSGAASVNGCSQLADCSDLLRTLTVSKAASLVVDPDVANTPWNTIAKLVTLDENNAVTSEELPDLKRVYFIRRVEDGGEGDFLQVLSKANESFQADDITSDDVCGIFNTSGSTGFSKLIVHTQKNVSEMVDMTPFWKNSDGKVDMSIAPMGWMGGAPCIPIFAGFTRVSFDARGADFPNDMPEFLWGIIRDEKCFFGYIPPLHLQQISELASKQTKENEKGDLNQKTWMMEYLPLGGLPVTLGMVESAFKISQKIIIGYGCTDSGIVSLWTITSPDQFSDFEAGPVCSEVDLKVVSLEDTDKEMPVGSKGQLLVKTPTMMKGFLNDPDATAASFTEDGYYCTGDVGWLDHRGHLFVEGRGSDAIMRGIYIFYPGWLEARIKAQEGVLEAVVVGVPDPAVHEELCACLILREGVTVTQVQEVVEKDIIVKHDDLLSPRPRYYLQFHDFPTTESGKPRRKSIKEIAAQRVAESKQIGDTK